MAARRKKEEGSEIDKLMAAAMANVKKLSGQEFVKIEDYSDTYGVPGYISFNLPSLDLQLGGDKERVHFGIPRGRVFELQGAESSFKSTFCYQLAADMLDQGGTVFWLSSEGDFDPEYARVKIKEAALDPADVESNFFVKPISTLEHLFDTMRGLMGPINDYAEKIEKAGGSPPKECPKILFILDSLSALMSSEDHKSTEKKGLNGAVRVGGQAGETHRFFKFFLIQWMRTGATFVFTSHLRANIGPSKTKTKAAHDIVTRHYCQGRIRTKSYNLGDENTSKQIKYSYGRKVEVKILKERNGVWIGTGEINLQYAHNYGWDIYLSIIDTFIATAVAGMKGSELVIDIDPEDDPVLAELNGVYSYQELKKLLDANVERCPEYIARSMRRDIAKLPDKRLHKGVKKDGE